MTYHFQSPPSTIYAGAAGFGNVTERPFEDITVKVTIAAVALVGMYLVYKLATEDDLKENSYDPRSMTPAQYRATLADPTKMSDETIRYFYERMKGPLSREKAEGHPQVIEEWRADFFREARRRGIRGVMEAQEYELPDISRYEPAEPLNHYGLPTYKFDRAMQAHQSTDSKEDVRNLGLMLRRMESTPRSAWSVAMEEDRRARGLQSNGRRRRRRR
jgi:hypothetical protein